MGLMGSYLPEEDAALAQRMSEGYGKTYGPATSIPQRVWDYLKRAYESGPSTLQEGAKYITDALRGGGAMLPGGGMMGRVGTMPQKMPWQMTKEEYISNAPYQHGTTQEGYEGIIKSGKFEPGKTRVYDYSEWGPDATYLTKRGGWWLDPEQAANARAMPYEYTVDAVLNPKASVLTLNTIDDVKGLAKRVGYDDVEQFLQDIMPDNLQTMQRTGRIDDNIIRSKQISNNIRRLGIDAIEIPQSIEVRPDSFLGVSGEQLVVLNNKMIKPAAKAHENEVRKAWAKGERVSPNILSGYGLMPRQ